MSSAMELSQKSLESIGIYVRQNLPMWLEQIDPRRDRELVLNERIVRFEEELKAQRELMRQGFEATDRRFEDLYVYLDKRFEQTDRRFEQQTKQIGRWMTVITVLITLIGPVGAWGTFVP